MIYHEQHIYKADLDSLGSANTIHNFRGPSSITVSEDVNHICDLKYLFLSTLWFISVVRSKRRITSFIRT